MIYIRNKKQSSGFTLLEMIVSLGIFTLVAVIATGSLVRITGLNRRAQALQATMNNIGFILESMSREMRFGSKIHCVNANTVNSDSIDASQTCGNGSKGIVFRSSKSGGTCQLAYAYWFRSAGSGVILKKSQQNACGDALKSDTGLDLVDSTNISITDITFSVEPGTRGYSLAKVGLVGYSGIKESEKNYFDIRTAVSQRIPD